MENEKRYEEILSRLRAAEPVLENGDALTSDILKRIEERSADRGRRRLLAAGWISSAAAVILLGWLAGELAGAPSVPPPVAANRADYREIVHRYEGMSRQEILRLLSERREESAKRRDALYLWSEKHSDKQ
jgi:hypothetical protein